eukprot:619013-Pelagomonas_calceolata.AAC.2
MEVKGQNRVACRALTSSEGRESYIIVSPPNAAKQKPQMPFTTSLKNFPNQSTILQDNEFMEGEISSLRSTVTEQMQQLTACKASRRDIQLTFAHSSVIKP